MTNLAALATIALVATMCMQGLNGKPASDVTKDEAGDEFARQAADALDSTLLFFKNGIDNFIQDSTKLTNMFSNLTDNIIKLAPTGDIQSNAESHQRLHNLSLRANRSFTSSGLFKMDD